MTQVFIETGCKLGYLLGISAKVGLRLELSATLALSFRGETLAGKISIDEPTYRLADEAFKAGKAFYYTTPPYFHVESQTWRGSLPDGNYVLQIAEGESNVTDDKD